MKLEDLGEHRFLDRLRRRRRASRHVPVGIGDDAALVSFASPRMLLTTDTLVEGVHFRLRWDTPAGLGARAYAVNASDLAAMGGSPRFALLSLTAPGRTDVAVLENLVRGFERAADKTGAALVGGNLARGDSLSISVTLAGDPAPRSLLRSGASCGDGIWVTGTLGGAAWGRALLMRGGSRPKSVLRAFLRPQARLEVGRALARRGLASSAIDVSDGLLQDLSHVCRASGVGAEIDVDSLPLAPAIRRLPRRRALELALAGGEDYELLFTVPGTHERRLRASSISDVTRIGTITEDPGIRVPGAPELARTGFDHFSS